MIGGENHLAAQTIVVAFGDFFVMVPYGLSLGVVTLVGGHLGQNNWKEAKFTCFVASMFSAVMAAMVCSTIALGSRHLAFFYTDNEEIAGLATVSFTAFGCAFVFDWIQC